MHVASREQITGLLAVQEVIAVNVRRSNIEVSLSMIAVVPVTTMTFYSPKTLPYCVTEGSQLNSVREIQGFLSPGLS